MRFVDFVKKRTPEWEQLESDISWLTSGSSKLESKRICQVMRRYRSVCSDLSFALAMNYPTETLQYLHQLVADGHSAVYCSETFRLMDLGHTLFVKVPSRVLRDPCTWISFSIFWGLFLLSMLGGMINPEFATAVVGNSTLESMEEMYSSPADRDPLSGAGSMMTGFYVLNNAGIGLHCFASGIFLGVGSLVTLGFNAIFLGSIFGHMSNTTASTNFFTFVTAHGPFELTAVVFSAAAGLRMGWSLLDTDGWSRIESLRRKGSQSLEIVGVATILFVFAAFIEGYVSPSSLPYSIKLAVALISTLTLVLYTFGLGILNRKGGIDSAGDQDET